MAQRTIQSPGVQLSETDISLRPAQNATNTVFIPGFAAKGPINEPITVGSISEFEQIFGLPTNGAERYLYQTVKAAIQSPATIITTRLPYGSGGGTTVSNQYSLLAYPVYSLSSVNTPTLSSTNLSIASGAYVFGTPVHFTLSTTDYQTYITNGISWLSSVNPNLSALSTIQNAGLIVVNKGQSVIDNQYQGLYVGLIDNTNNLPTTSYDCINTIQTLVSGDTYITVPNARMNFALSAVNPGPAGSLSEALEAGLQTFDISQNTFNDTVTLGVFKLRQSVFAPDANVLDFVVTEGYVGSLDANRLINNPRGGPAISFDLVKKTSGSSNIEVLVNPYISQRLTHNGWQDANGVPKIAIRTTPTNATGGSLYPLGVYSSTNETTSLIGTLPTKVYNALQQVVDPDIYPLTIVCEAGLGTIYANSLSTSGYFDDYNTPVTLTDSLFTQKDGTPPQNSSLYDNYQAVLTQFTSFVTDSRRRDHIVIADPLANIFVQNNKTKTINIPGNNFTSNIYWPLRNLFSGVNTSYVVSYANWVHVTDNNSSANVWVPFSGFAAALMASTNFVWDAPAGFTRGILNNVLDIAVYPTQKHRDQLYNINQNPVTFFPSDGFITYGQKTLQRKPSAFDRINVRRLFNYLETNTRNTAKYFVFEPNTLFTRTQVINTLTPIFAEAQNAGGLYDFRIICDENNNPPSVIDQNELVVDIYIKPVRTAEFILVNFYAVSTGANFNEIIG
jgi:hypothetical protein